ncbi:hypothetical protein SAMN04488089_10977 [Myroides profundi]|uniref:Uncharacterized protein n=1 Tax=Myroides profundi TaxID=480520 RepID=A0AAJ4W506_MYRPR|nr:hypothetical protein MPR_2317 [Myroides profundi]SER09152.1 hypothetical protein SAMN04488089_10977 [Myroides profundi]
MGTLELTLADGSVNYRYILVRNIYKIIYFIEACTVFIVTIWDCRQEKNYI